MEEYVGTLKTVEIPWIYEKNEDGEIEITGIDFSRYECIVDDAGYTTTLELGTDTLIIPSQLEGKNVVKLELTDSVLPDGVDINYNLKIPDVKKIIVGEFMTEMRLNAPRQVGLSPCVFTEVSQVVLPKSLAKIGNSCFHDMKYLLYMDLSDYSISTLAERAFSYCTNLELSLPNTVTSIDSSALLGVPVVNFPNGINESLTIPEDKWGVTKITIEGVEYVPET